MSAILTQKPLFPRVNRKNAPESFSARCMTMHETEWRSVWARPVSQRLIFGCFRPPASFFRFLLVARSSTVKGKSSHNPAPFSMGLFYMSWPGVHWCLWRGTEPPDGWKHVYFCVPLCNPVDLCVASQLRLMYAYTSLNCAVFFWMP